MKSILKFIVQHYLRLLARIVLWRHKPMVIAVAGATNKTFIKELILKEIGSKMKVRGNPKSFNTEIGLPLAVLFLPSGYSSIFRWADVLLEGTFISLFSRKFPEVLVLEMGVDCKGDMNYLLSIVKPDMALITNVDRSFPDSKILIDDIVDEMRTLVGSVDKNGIVLLNGDDNRVRKLEDDSVARVITWGACDSCIVKISELKNTNSGQKFILNINGREEVIEINKFGYHNASAFVAAKAAAKEILKKKKNKGV